VHGSSPVVVLWSYGGGSWDKDGKPALNTPREANLKALRFAVGTIREHKIQPPGPDWLGGRLEQRSLQGGQARDHEQWREPLLRDGQEEGRTPKALLVLTPGGATGSFVRARAATNWGNFNKTKSADLCEDLIRYVEDMVEGLTAGGVKG
jgi:hypothetical protein